MIPKKIHYCWFGGKEPPYIIKKCIDSWVRHCPNYEIIRWDESNFNTDMYPFTKSAVEQGEWAFVSDFARLQIIYDYGGIYLDTDIELLKDMDNLLKYDFFIGVQQYGNVCTTGLGFGAVKKNNTVKKMIDRYDGIVFDKKIKKDITCPKMNDPIIREMGYITSDKLEIIGNSIILPSKYLDPIAPGNSKNLLCDETISIHHYSASWSKKGVRLKRAIITTIGQDRINRIKDFLR